MHGDQQLYVTVHVGNPKGDQKCDATFYCSQSRYKRLNTFAVFLLTKNHQFSLIVYLFTTIVIYRSVFVSVTSL